MKDIWHWWGLQFALLNIHHPEKEKLIIYISSVRVWYIYIYVT